MGMAQSIAKQAGGSGRKGGIINWGIGEFGNVGIEGSGAGNKV